MPITVVCPKCSAKLNAPDAAAGKKVKCPKPGCGTVIPVPAPGAPAFEVVDEAPKSQPVAKKAAKVAIEDDVPPNKKLQKSRDDDDEDEQPKSKLKKSRKNDDDEDEEEDRPKSKRRREEDTEEEEIPKSKRRREEDTQEEEIPKSNRRRDDDDEEDERPKSKRRRDDDDEEEDDRPRMKKKKKAGGIPPVAIVGIVVGALVVMGGVGYGIYAFAFSDDKDSNTTSSGTSGGGGSTMPPKVGPPPGWVEFKDEQAGFKAYFPGKPREDNDGTDVKIYEFEDQALKNSCLVLVLTPKAKEDNEALVKKYLAETGAKELSHNSTTLAGMPATEYLYEAPPDQPPAKGARPGKGLKKGGEQNPGRGVFRVLFANKKIYVVALASETGMPKSNWILGFFDNFELLK